MSKSEGNTGDLITLLPDDATIFWRVKARDDFGLETWCLPDSLGWSFNVYISDSPDLFGLLSPADEDTVWSLESQLIWHESEDPDFDKLALRVARLAGLFAENGSSLLLETGQEAAETLLVFLDEMEKRGAQNVGVNFDPANMILYDMDDPIEALRQLAPHVQQVHVKDAKRTDIKGQWGDEVVVGTGEVDWVAFVRILAEADFDGSYVFEREAGDDRLGDIAQGIAALSAAMQEVTA